MKKRLVALGLAVCMVAAGAVGCGTKKTEEKVETAIVFPAHFIHLFEAKIPSIPDSFPSKMKGILIILRLLFLLE